MDKRSDKPCIIGAKVKEYLAAVGTVCIEGPRWRGRAWTPSYHSKSRIYIGNPDSKFQNQRLSCRLHWCWMARSRA